jgi:hypothetical protein
VTIMAHKHEGARPGPRYQHSPAPSSPENIPRPEAGHVDPRDAYVLRLARELRARGLTTRRARWPHLRRAVATMDRPLAMWRWKAIDLLADDPDAAAVIAGEVLR